MNILILGYGYSGYHCAKALLRDNHHVTAVSRSYPVEYKLDHLHHIKSDIRNLSVPNQPDAILYCVPPQPQGVTDDILTETLRVLERKLLLANLVYWGSSGVYGDHQGNWVDEASSCNITFDLQRRRLYAESQIINFATKNNKNWTVMRVAGMYGENRLPKLNNPVIKSEQAPFSNMIYIEDAAKIAAASLLSNSPIEIINVSDGTPIKMGTLQRLVAKQKKIPIIEKSYEEIMANASPMRKYFLSSSKQLSNEKCRRLFPDIIFSSLAENI